MFKKVVSILFLVFISSFAQQASVNAMTADDVDPEKITHLPVQTRNGKGMNFNTLGSFEERFLGDCRALEISEDPDLQYNILFIAEGFGRLPMRVLRDPALSMSFTTLFVNELSLENLRPFERKLKRMAASGKVCEVQAASRVRLIPGDCLDLPSNPAFRGSFGDRGPFNCTDLIMGANFLHFFEGGGVLDYFINTFNFLRPGGSGYIFTQSRAPNFTYDQLKASGNPGAIYMKTCFGIMEAAQRDPDILFPGLICDEWLVGKSPALKHVLSTKPNGLEMINFIPLATLQRVAHALGFKVVFQKCYNYAHKHGSAHMTEDENGDYCGLVLKKPEGSRERPLKRDDLDPAFVKACLTAKEVMKKFIDTELDFPAGYPFVAVKKGGSSDKKVDSSKDLKTETR